MKSLVFEFEPSCKAVSLDCSVISSLLAEQRTRLFHFRKDFASNRVPFVFVVVLFLAREVVETSEITLNDNDDLLLA
jgi:hypothetical protein